MQAFNTHAKKHIRDETEYEHSLASIAYFTGNRISISIFSTCLAIKKLIVWYSMYKLKFTPVDTLMKILHALVVRRQTFQQFVYSTNSTWSRSLAGKFHSNLTTADCFFSYSLLSCHWR